MAKVSSIMATKIALDTVEASTNIRSLTARVNTLTKSWQVQETELRTAEDYLGAAQARYEGLSEAIEAQKDKISALEAKQQDLGFVTDEDARKFGELADKIDALKIQQNSLDDITGTNKDKYEELGAEITKLRDEQKELGSGTVETANKFLHYQQQIDASKTKLASMTAQQAKARESMNYYADGMDKVKSSLKTVTNSSNLLIERLKAENKGYQANYEQSRLYSAQLEKMAVLYDKEKAALARIAETQGTDSKAYRKTSNALDELETRITETSIKQKELNKTFSNTHPRIAQIHDAYDKMNRSVSEVGHGVGEAAKKIAIGATTAAVSVAGVSAGFALASKNASDLQATYTQTANLLETGGEATADVTKKVADMQKDGREMSLKYGISQEKIADAYQELVKRGDNSSQALASMRSEVQASIASGDDLSDVVNVTSNAMESFGLKVDKAGNPLKSTSEMAKRTSKAVNELAFAADKTSTNFSDLGVGMSYVGATAHTAGFSLGETASAMGILSNNGLEADKAGTGLRKTIQSLTDPTAAADKALQGIGLSAKSFVDQSGKMKSMSDIFGMLADHTKDMSKSQKAVLFHTLFGTTGEQAGAILTDNAARLKILDDEVERASSHNYVGKLAEKNMQTAQAAMNQFKMAAQDVEMTLAKAVLPTVTSLAEHMANVANSKGFEDMIQGIGRDLAGVGDHLQHVFEYVDANSGKLTTIGSNLNHIIGDLANGVWSGFKDTISTIARTILSLSGESATGDALEDVNRALADISSHAGTIKAIGETFATYFVAKKMLGFAQSIGTVVDGIKGLGEAVKGGSVLEHVLGLDKKDKDISDAEKLANNIADRVTTKIDSKVSKDSFVEKEFTPKNKSAIAETAASDAGEIAEGASKVVAKTAGKAGFFKRLFTKDPMVEQTAVTSGLRMGASLGKGLTLATSTIDIAKGFFEKGKKQYSDVGSGIGGLIGTGIGSTLGPVGAAVGGVIGSSIGKFAGEKLRKPINDLAKKAGIQFGTDFGNNVHLKVDKNMKQFSSDFSKFIDTINKNNRIKLTADPSSFNKVVNQNKSAYDKMSKDMNNYYANKEKSSNKDLSILVKNGNLTQAQADKILKNEQNNDNKRKQSQQKTLNDMQLDDKQYLADKLNIEQGNNHKLEVLAVQYGKNSKEYKREQNRELSALDESHNQQVMADRKKLNNGILAETKIGNANLIDAIKINNGKQLDLLSELKENKHHLTLSEMHDAISTSTHEMNAVISNAQKTRDEAVKAANDKYNKTVDAANQEYYVKGTISKQQYDEIVGNARKQKDDTITAADKQANHTISDAKETHTKVVDEATKEAGEHKSAVDTETGDTLSSWQQWIVKMAHKVNSFTGAIDDVLNKLHKGWGSIPKWKPTGYATGTRGLAHDEIALVGEQGFELAHDREHGIYPVGLNGPEIRPLMAGTSILPHDMSQQFLAMTATLPAHADGVDGTIHHIYKDVKKAVDSSASWLQDKMKHFDDFISEGADKVMKFITDHIGIASFEDMFNKNNDTLYYELAKGSFDHIIDEGKSLLDNFINKFNASHSGKGGGVVSKNIGAHTGSWRGDIEKIAKEMHVDVSDSDMNALLARIQKESGGDQSIKQQVWDVNMANGDPAQGLFQYIPPTFAYWSLPGHNNILSGDDQIMAVFNDSNWRSDIRMPGGWGPTGHRVFANGGIINQPTMGLIGEAGYPEAVVPMSNFKETRAWSLVKAVMDKFSDGQTLNELETTNNHEDNGIQELTNQVKKLKDIVSALLGVNGQQLKAIKANNIDPQARYRQQALDQSMSNLQSF